MCAQLVQSYALTLGNGRWEQQVLRLELVLALAPRINRLTARFPAEAGVNAAPGDICQLVLGNGEREEMVFTGIIGTLRRSYAGTEITAIDAGGQMAAIRPAVTFEDVSAGRVVRELAGEAGIQTGSIVDGVDLAFFVADPRQTAWEHVARLAAWSGAFAHVDADGRLECFEIGTGQADEALAHGRDLTALGHRSRHDEPLTLQAAPEAAAGTASAPEALRLAVDTLGGATPAADRRILFRPALRTPDAAGRAGVGATRLSQASARRMDVEGWLQPQLRPGQKLELQELPERLETGIGWIEMVHHRIAPHGATTRVRALRDPDGFDPMALLGSLGSALGAVL